MDLSDCDAANATANTARLLEHAALLVRILDFPDQVAAPDGKLHDLATQNYYTAQPPRHHRAP
jgi:hypothetical protein